MNENQRQKEREKYTKMYTPIQAQLEYVELKEDDPSCKTEIANKVKVCPVHHILVIV